MDDGDYDSGSGSGESADAAGGGSDRSKPTLDDAPETMTGLADADADDNDQEEDKSSTAGDYAGSDFGSDANDEVGDVGGPSSQMAPAGTRRLSSLEGIAEDVDSEEVDDDEPTPKAGDGDDDPSGQGSTAEEEPPLRSSVASLPRPTRVPPVAAAAAAGTASSRPALKFNYEPLNFERPYYEALFLRAKVADRNSPILPPGEAAELFLSSGIPAERLRSVWNMSVAPAVPYPPGTKPPPAMTFEQFRTAVRLIQLFQNGAAALNARLGVKPGTKLVPAFFSGISGVSVPLPWSDEGAAPGSMRSSTATAPARVLERRSSSFSVASANAGSVGGPPPKRLSSFGAKPSTFGAGTEDVADPSTFGAGASAVRRSTSGTRRASSISVTPSIDARMHSSFTSMPGQAPPSDIGEEQRRPSAGNLVQFDGEDDYAMSDDEIHTYRETFERHCALEPNVAEPQRHVYVDEAVQLFTKSGMDRDVLGKLWDVVVSDANSLKLDEVEFVLMTHLVVCATRKNLSVPETLPAPLRIWRENQGQRQPSANDAESAAGDDAKGYNDRSRIAVLERDVGSLKEMVVSLTTEIQGLKNMLSDDNKRSGDGARKLDVSSAYTNKPSNGSSRGSRMMDASNTSRGSSRDDKPNVDVEMYWGTKKGDDKGHDSFSDYEEEEEEEEEPYQPVDRSQRSQPEPTNLGISNRPRQVEVLEVPGPGDMAEEARAAAFEGRGRAPGILRPPSVGSDRPYRPTPAHAPSPPVAPVVDPRKAQRMSVSRNIPSMHRSAINDVGRSFSAGQVRPPNRPPTGRQRYSAGDRAGAQAFHRSTPASNGMAPPPQSNPLPKVERNPPRKSQALFQSMPASRMDGSAPVEVSPKPKAKRHGTPNGMRDRLAASTMMPGHSDSLESQLKKMQREDDFNSLLQKTKMRLSDPAADSDSQASGSRSSSRRHRQGGGPSNGFQPAQLKGRRRNKDTMLRAPLDMRASIQASAHVIRRQSGETEIYKEVSPKSTAAVDLPPL